MAQVLVWVLVWVSELEWALELELEWVLHRRRDHHDHHDHHVVWLP